MKVLENVMIIQILEKFISKNFLNVKVISKNIQVFPKERFFFAESTKKTLKHLSSLLISNGYLHTEYRVAFRTQSNT